MNRAFTIVELLVVITIIVVLMALLIPGMDRAIEQAQRAVCLANQRNIVQSLMFYAQDGNRWLPPTHGFGGDGTNNGSAFDLRALNYLVTSIDPLPPRGLGFAVDAGYLPVTQLGNVIHCPSLRTENAGPPVGGVSIANWGMDRIGQTHVGASFWEDPAYYGYRVVPSYNYRSASWFNTGRGQLRTSKMGPDFILSVDFLDPRFGIEFHHFDGYNRIFADGHGGFLRDPSRTVEQLAGQRHVDGNTNPALDEDLYEHYIKTQP